MSGWLRGAALGATPGCRGLRDQPVGRSGGRASVRGLRGPERPGAHGGLHAELLRQIEARGIATRSVDGTAPADCRYLITYTANWRWDLSYARIELSVRGQPVGSAVYDATQGGGNFDKFGPTGEKIAPLVAELVA